MKNIATIIIITIFALSATDVMAQKSKGTETVVIKTSTQCGMCKSTVEKAMAYEKGIISSNLNIEKAELTVVFKPAKTSLEKIRVAISKVGYDADDVKAVERAYNNLPNCCKVGGMDRK